MQVLTHKIVSFGTGFMRDLYSRCVQNQKVVEAVIGIAVTALAAVAILRHFAKDKIKNTVSKVSVPTSADPKSCDTSNKVNEVVDIAK